MIIAFTLAIMLIGMIGLSAAATAEPILAPVPVAAGSKRRHRRIGAGSPATTEERKS